MAADDAVAATTANEARASIAAIDQHARELRDTLQALGYGRDLEHLDAFVSRFEEYRRLADEVLSLTVENSNVKAQRLSFGPAADSAEAFRTALAAASQTETGSSACCVREQSARAWAALLEIRALHARHIAEADDGEMDRLEARMNASAKAAGGALGELARSVPAALLAPARQAFDRFMAVHAEIVQLSRRNSNVRALALSLGRQQTLAAECEAQLRALEEALAKHEFRATR
jgi:hypothetical protein